MPHLFHVGAHYRDTCELATYFGLFIDYRYRRSDRLRKTRRQNPPQSVVQSRPGVGGHARYDRVDHCSAVGRVIKTILFDLGNVIVPFDFKRAYAKLGPLCGCEAADIPARIRSTDLVTRFETGQVGPEQFIEE